MKLYVNLRRPRLDAYLLIDFDLEKETCRLLLEEKCSVCLGQGCEFRAGLDCPASGSSTVFLSETPGRLNTILTPESLNELLGPDGITTIKRLISQQVWGEVAI